MRLELRSRRQNAMLQYHDRAAFVHLGDDALPGLREVEALLGGDGSGRVQR